MKVIIKDQDHRVTLKITEARVSLLQQVTPSTVQIQISFLATHYCRKEIQTIEEEGETITKEVEVSIAFEQPIIYDTLIQTVPFDLWVGIVKSAENPEMLELVNAALVEFNGLFANSMSGLQLELKRVEMG